MSACIRHRLAWSIGLAVVCSSPVLANDLSDADCVVEPHLTVELSTSANGIVEAVLVDRGDKVRSGQVLVKLESGVEQSTVEQARLRTNQMTEIDLAKTQLEFARKKRDRTMQLFQDRAVSEFNRDEAELEVRTAELEVERATENRDRALLDLDRAEEVLKLRTILSPIDGVVVDRLVSKGEAIGEPQKVLMNLVQIDPLNVELIVPASEFGKLEVGMPLTVTLGYPVEGAYRAEITIIDPIIDVASGTFGVRATLPNKDLKIPAGLNCTAVVATED